MFDRRACLTVGALMLARLLTGCADSTPSTPRRKPKIPFRKAQEMLPSIHTEEELNARFGPPHSVDVFDPGHPNEPVGLNRTPRERWRDLEVFIPPKLLDTLPVGTRMVENEFYNKVESPGIRGHLIAYIDEKGKVLGWSYSVAFTDKWMGMGAVLEDLP
jgi:hypothetical protein